MAEVTLDALAALGEEPFARMAWMPEDVDTVGHSLIMLEWTTAELRQDVTRLGKRIDGIEARVERIEWRLDARGIDTSSRT